MFRKKLNLFSRFRTLEDKQIRLDSVIKAGTIYSIRKCHIRDQSTGSAYFAAAKIHNISKTNLARQQEELERVMLDMEISKISHDSILQFYGAWVADGSAHLAYEFAGKVDFPLFGPLPDIYAFRAVWTNS